MKEWIKVSHSAAGITVVTVTQQDGNLSARWSVRSSVSHIAQGVREARGYCVKALDGLRAAHE